MKRLAACLVLGLAACGGGTDAVDETVDPTARVFDFRQGQQEWTSGFADYPPGEEAFYELDAGYRALPAEVGPGSALFISGNNHSDDLFMFWKRRLDGLDPGRTYRVRFDQVQFASEAPGGCPGAGGAPAEAVAVKAGASTVEPLAVVQGDRYRLNVDKGNQSTGGSAALVLGNIANGRACGEPLRFALRDLDSGAQTISAAADANGALWIFVGTDSGFEATTRLYYTRVAVSLLE